MWKRLLLGITIAVTALNFALASFSVIQGEVNLFNDVGRDFLILREITEKKVVLIGARSNINGLFHGPLWYYLNYPVFLLGQGNPVVQAWFWLMLTGVMVGVGTFIAKKLFGFVPACLYTIMLSGNMIYRNNDGFFHGHATVFLTAPFFYTLVRYHETGKWPYLVLNIILGAAMTQFMLAMLPLLGISFLAASYTIINRRLWLHWASFLIVPFFFVNFVIFDYRHNHEMFKAITSYAQAQQSGSSLFSFWQDRLYHVTNLQLSAWMVPPLTYIFFALTLVATFWQVRQFPKQKYIYALLALVYFGFFFSTLFNKGILLYHYVFAMMPLSTLWFISLAQGKLKKLIIVLTGVLVTFNVLNTVHYFNYLQTNFIGKDKNSWLGMSAVAQEVIKRQDGKPFGYFVFAPDAFAYQPRYAMLYNFEAAGFRGNEYVKEPTTYVIAQEPPADDPYMTHVWWRKNPVGISSEPVKTDLFPNRFTLEEFSLTQDEINKPHDKTIELGLHFR